MEELCLNLCEVGALKFGDFKMKVGLNSPVYFDLRIITSYPKLMDKLSDIVWKHVQDLHIKCDVVCGVPYTALPISTLVSVKSNIPMLVRRKEPKNYGTMKIIEGKYSENDSCLIIEDVVTSGGSILETAADLRKAGLKVSDVVVMIDREQGGHINLDLNGVKMHSVFTLTKILEILLKRNKLDSATVTKIKDYLRENQMFTDGSQMLKDCNRLIMKYQDRIPFTSCEASKRLFSIIDEKMTNLCVAVDVSTTAELINMVDQVGPFVCIIKTHYDAITDWSESTEIALKELATKYNFMIMEDRKLGDIGNTIKMQCKKLFLWANFVTMHSVAGAGSLEGVKQVLEDRKSDGAVVLIAQLSSKDNLISKPYTSATVAMWKENKGIISGFVCQDGSIINDPGMLQFTPGVSAQQGNDSMDQQYNLPEVAVNKGADIVIIGRAITQTSNPAKVAEEFREKLWVAYTNRIKN